MELEASEVLFSASLTSTVRFVLPNSIQLLRRSVLPCRQRGALIRVIPSILINAISFAKFRCVGASWHAVILTEVRAYEARELLSLPPAEMRKAALVAALGGNSGESSAIEVRPQSLQAIGQAVAAGVRRRVRARVVKRRLRSLGAL
jgi:hypothetical protein